MKRALIILALLAALLLGGALQAQPVCYEDMACWNCETMGNRICGAGYGPPWADRLPYPFDQTVFYLIDTFSYHFLEN